jgi:hypothetical protein
MCTTTFVNKIYGIPKAAFVVSGVIPHYAYFTHFFLFNFPLKGP